MSDEVDDEDEDGDGVNLLETFRGLLFSDDVVEIGNRIYKLGKYGKDAAFAYFSDGEESSEAESETRFNWDVLSDPGAEIRIVEKGPDEPPFSKIEIENDEIFELNYSVLNEDEQERFSAYFEDAYESQGRLLTHEEEIGYYAADEARKDQSIQDILDYFDFLDTQDKRLIRRGLSIRKAWEDDRIYIDRDQIEDWKNDLEEAFGEYGSTVANFCSSGYYDLDSVLPWMMDNIRDEYDNLEKIRSLYYDILDNEPFVVYVGRWDNPGRISVKLRQKIKQYDSYEYDIPFVQLRAQGFRNMRVAEQAIENLDGFLPDEAIRTDHTDVEFVFTINPELVEDSSE